MTATIATYGRRAPHAEVVRVGVAPAVVPAGLLGILAILLIL